MTAPDLASAVERLRAISDWGKHAPAGASTLVLYSDLRLVLDALAAAQARLAEAEAALGQGPAVDVVYIGDGLAKLCVNGYGVARWVEGERVAHLDCDGETYAEEAAKVLRNAIGAWARAALAKLRQP